MLSNGEKVPPDDAEQAIMGDTTFEHVMLIGEGRSHLGLLCAAKTQDLSDLCRRANTQLKDFPGYARIRYIARVAGPWGLENGLLSEDMLRKKPAPSN